MNGVLPTAAAIHVAVLADVDHAGVDTVAGVLAYAGRGRRHLQPIDATPSAAEVSRLLAGRAPAQLQLPINIELPDPSSSVRCWRTWVLPSVPPRCGRRADRRRAMTRVASMSRSLGEGRGCWGAFYMINLSAQQRFRAQAREGCADEPVESSKPASLCSEPCEQARIH